MSTSSDKSAGSNSSSPLDYEALFRQSSTPSLVMTPDLIIVDANDAYLRVTSRKLVELVDLPLFEAFPLHIPEAGTIRDSLYRVRSNKVPETVAAVHYPIARDPAIDQAYEDRYWSATHVPVLDDRGEVVLLMQNVFDVTEMQTRENEKLAPGTADDVTDTPLAGVLFRHARLAQGANSALHAERHYLRTLFEQAPGFVAILKGPEHIFELTNKAYRQLIGREAVGMKVREALPDLADQKFFSLLDHVYQSREPYVGRAEHIIIHPPGEDEPRSIYVDFIFQAITDEDNTVSGIFVSGHDVTESYKLEKELGYLAAHDDLTGLLNRREFKEKLGQAIRIAQDTRASYVLLHLDLDQFKVVNDTCGHAAGDELLRRCSDLLSEGLPVDATLARLGSDEFGVLLADFSIQRGAALAESLRERLSDVEFCWGSLRFGLGVSVGVVGFDGAGFTLKEILSTAASACYLAKEKGRNRIHVYDSGDAELIERRQEMDWLGRLRSALQENRLLLYGQRISLLGGAGHEPEWVEVLVRLEDVDGTLVQPMSFLPAAERYNLSPQIDRYMVRAVIAYVANQKDAAEKHFYSINLSGLTLNDPNFVDFAGAQAAQFGINPASICFEITETAAVANLTNAARMMTELKALGFMFALDDFGSGMSSFAYLKTLPVDFLKIDGRFVRDIVDDPIDCAMVDATARIARVMGIKTVAEYAETEAVLSRLAEIGVDYAQGFIIHRPEPLLALDANR
ncbi:EAL domain-containing protein [Hydrocarboniclastica marina]|uniref:EAL domain-containing protein n=1 Tax=Hydrocarboniclastica marina TaxID=2259620 RepID=A0A4P7XIE2_9ALTE|nr:EAL domain-containing protein [Hydrocarboniclastica marina]QCF26859.1 EAL domain-containing protein [Hydrocarboniclastica marina]